MRHIVHLTLILILAFTCHTSQSNKQYSLSPNLPPTAFIGQYYTCNFRVSGLATPSFTFNNLPSCFTASKSGTIEGIPNQTGSFSVSVNYQQAGTRGQEVIVLRITEPDYNSSLGQSLNKPNDNLNWITLDVPSTYKVGDKVSANLNRNAKQKYKWTYLQLPQMLSGDADGNLNGVFYDEGYYSFGATCSDTSGNSLDYFFTINVQPLSSRTSLYQVPNRNVFIYDQSQIDALQASAKANVAKARKVANEASDQLGRIKGDVATTQSNLKMAQTQAAVVEKLAKIALDQKAVEFNKVNVLQTKLDNAQAKAAIKQTAYDQSVKNTNLVQTILDAATKLFRKMTEIFATINKQFITAQDQSIKAAANLQLAQRNVDAANEDINAAFQDVSNAKKVLQALNNNKSIVEFNVNTAFDNRDVANFQNDAANAAINTADKALGKALQDLQAANSTVFQIQQEALYAKNQLGIAEFNLKQAMNVLFVAQAAKQQSDKALLLASAQSAQLPSGTSTYIFSGCDIGNYPIISGTASITACSDGGFELNSGYKIVYGHCTNGGDVTFTKGDTVAFHGYLKNGFIHGINIGKQ